jgi:hypothetical protein
METLYPDDAPGSNTNAPVRPAPVLIGALNEKFPPGTDVEELKKYVAKLDGKCEQSKPGQPMTCSFVETGTACAQTEVVITAKTTASNKIGHIVAFRNHKVC